MKRSRDTFAKTVDLVGGADNVTGDEYRDCLQKLDFDAVKSGLAGRKLEDAPRGAGDPPEEGEKEADKRKR